jgi:hypothetical protein
MTRVVLTAWEMELVPRVFLLSPARSAGRRARLLVHSPDALGQALRSPQGAPLGEVFAWLSSLYFRGKLAYAERFGARELAVPGVLVMAPRHGLCRPSTRIRSGDLAAMGEVDVAADNPAFVAPLLRDARLLASALPEHGQVVLLGSIATAKYVDPLLEVLGERLLFPTEFVGRGDMSRGGLLLRAAREGRELAYTPLHSAARTGRRARRLAELGP